MRTFVSCVPDEHPKQPANVESLLGFSGDFFTGILSQKKKKKHCSSAGKKRLGCQDVLFHPWSQCSVRSCTTPLGFIDIKIPAQLYVQDPSSVHYACEVKYLRTFGINRLFLFNTFLQKCGINSENKLG